ncbi:unnamed protein product [Blepharisma stoltei]|uniref:Uncharacterized protein n=1 Tax=Blepharisma stoltei TaxID=1481888 RepID=A0AAU9JF21_9CILI|nr:unnamed protein product [Blepharisma stoltei]
MGNWYYGLGDRYLISKHEKCTLTPPGYPWPGVLPDRTLNLFSNLYSAGSNKCPEQEEFSSFQSGILSIWCPSNATIIEQPDFLSMRNDTFVLTDTGMENWSKIASGLQKKYSVNGTSSYKINSEWFQVFCENKENYYVQNVVKDEVVKRIEGKMQERSVKPMNLVVFMIDTVSRARVYRKMQNLANYLENLNKTGNSQVFQFFRIISNGISTAFNTRAMYSGSQLRQNRSGRPFWDIFQKQGNAALFLNGFCEDWQKTFLKKEFSDINYAVFFPWCHFDCHPLQGTFGNFAGPFSILRRCINGDYLHNYIIEYLNQFWKNHEQFGKVVLIPFQEGHEGTGEVISVLDPDLTNFLKKLEKSGDLNQTVVVITSDHGLHMGPYYTGSKMGAFEEKLPTLFMIYPQWFINKYPEFRQNLAENEQRLVSHYDTYWTFRHLATLPEFGGEISENFEENSNLYEDTWDCQKNLYYMEASYQFIGKKWRKDFYSFPLNITYTKINDCFTSLQYTPKVYENLTSIPYSEISKENDKYNRDKALETVLLDKDVRYWFEDAYQDVIKKLMLKSKEAVGQEDYVLESKTLEEESWDTLKAPGRGRYLFGRSLLKYTDDRSCDMAGIPNCVCDGDDSITKIIAKSG